MVAKVLMQELDGTPAQITFAKWTASTFSPTAANDLRHASATDTEVELNLDGVLDTEARASAKADLGAHFAYEYRVRAAFEFATAPTAGAAVELYWGESQHATAATGNPGGLTGSDADYAGYSANLADSVAQLTFIGNFPCTVQATTTVQIATVGVLYPKNRYGILVVKNESAVTFGDAVENHVVFDPIIPESQ